MKINIKYAGTAVVILISLLLSSCMQEAVGPVGKTSATLQINLSNSLKGTNTPLADAMLNRSNSLDKLHKVTNANGDTLVIDEVKIVLLDMSKYSSWNDFISKWEATGQYGLMDTTIFYEMERAGKDYFDIYRTVFKSYTGTEYSYIGDYQYSLSSGKADATFYLNPGLNYYYYAFRSTAKDTTVYSGDGHLNVVENADNTIHIGKLDVTGSYSGTWSNSQGDTTGMMTLDIYQAENDSVKGILVMHGFSCYDTLYAGGKITSPNYFSLYIAAQGYSGSLSLIPEGSSATGNWYISPSCRSFYSGSANLQRTSATPNLGKTK